MRPPASAFDRRGLEAVLGGWGWGDWSMGVFVQVWAFDHLFRAPRLSLIEKSLKLSMGGLPAGRNRFSGYSRALGFQNLMSLKRRVITTSLNFT